MHIIADENIPQVKQAFAAIGQVKTVPGRLICQDDLTQADILLVRSVTPVNAKLLRGSRVKFVASATSGINHIDTEYLKNNNIAFAHAAGSNAISVAQYVMAGICHWSILRNKPLNTLSIGIIGYGNVGIQLEKLCKKLHIKCVINDPPLAENNPTNFDSLESALACDIVSLHVPYTSVGKMATKHLINKNSLQLLRSECLLINTSRGGVIDEKALLRHKITNPDIYFILDVWENEPNLNTELLKFAFIATAHIAGYSYDGKLRGTEMIAQQCCEYFKLDCQWSVDEIKLNMRPVQEIVNLKKGDVRINILKAYDILKDNDDLKQILNDSSLIIPDYFDKLRKNYLIRREWKGII